MRVEAIATDTSRSLILFAAAMLASGQLPTPRLIIDGALNDSFWTTVHPEALGPGAGGTIRTVVAGSYLYIAARLPEARGRITARSIGQNPAWEDEDILRITAGAGIGYTDRVLQVNALGAYSLEKARHVPTRSESTYPYSDERDADIVYQNIERFLVAAKVDDEGWTVEAAFPLSELSAPGPTNIFVRADRIRAHRQGAPAVSWRWPVTGPAARVPVMTGVKWDAPAPLFQPPLIGNKEPALEVARVPALPPVDSRWDMGLWRDVPVWHLRRDEPMPRAPRFATQVKALHNGQVLSVFARCSEPGPVQAEVKENDGAVDRDDSFHIYLATSGSTYLQIVANALGYLRDDTGFSGGPRVSRAREWDSGTRVAVQEEPGAWTVRFDIPLELAAQALGRERIPNDWRVLLMRVRAGRPGEPREAAVLPVIQSETALATARYRSLKLTALDSRHVATEPLPPESPFEWRVLSAQERDRMRITGMLERNMRERARTYLELERKDRDAIHSRVGWEEFRDVRLNAMRRWLGKFPARIPLEARVSKEYSGSGYKRQDLIYKSRPGMWVTANLYLPSKPLAKMPGIVIVHSHHRPRTQAELQDMGILWARAGCAVLIMDQIGHGERVETYPWNREGYHSRYTTGMQLYVAGESLVKWMAWDIMRGVDLLLERNDVNKEQIILLGAVAGGGDPAAVTAAIDPRIAAVAPFNFGGATPEQGPGVSRWGAGLADPGWGQWETTRSLPGSIRGQYLPWLICASVAPRRFILPFEMGWEVEKVPIWAQYRKIFKFYDALDNLDEAHGFGGFPGPGECANIGPSQRKTMYPELHRWFGIPIPVEEPQDRRPEAELAALTPTVAAEIKMTPVHQLAHQVAELKVQNARLRLAGMNPAAKRKWLQTEWANKIGDIEPNRQANAQTHWTRQWGDASVQGLTLEVEAGIVVPLFLLRPASSGSRRLPVVAVVSQGGNERFMHNRMGEVQALLRGGAAVCLLDVRGVGETSPDLRRNPLSAGISLAATELMLGNTLLAARLKDLRSVLAYLAKRSDLDSQRIAVWGDSDVPANPPRLLLEESAGWRIGPEIQQQAEPLGGLLAILAGLYEDDLRAVAARRSLISYLSILENQFTYVPADVVVPGIVEVGDIAEAVEALSTKALLIEEPVNGRNRLLTQSEMERTLASAVTAYQGVGRRITMRSSVGTARMADWLLAQF